MQNNVKKTYEDVESGHKVFRIRNVGSRRSARRRYIDLRLLATRIYIDLGLSATWRFIGLGLSATRRWGSLLAEESWNARPC